MERRKRGSQRRRYCIPPLVGESTFPESLSTVKQRLRETERIIEVITSAFIGSSSIPSRFTRTCYLLYCVTHGYHPRIVRIQACPTKLSPNIMPNFIATIIEFWRPSFATRASNHITELLRPLNTTTGTGLPTPGGSAPAIREPR